MTAFRIAICIEALLFPVLVSGCAAGDREALHDAYTLEANGVTLAVNEAAAPVLEALGEPQNEFTAPVCAFDGKDVLYTYDHFELDVFYPDGQAEGTLYSIVLTDDVIATPEGVYIGDTADHVRERYGDCQVQSGTLSYEGQGMKLDFILRQDRVASVRYVSTLLEENGGKVSYEPLPKENSSASAQADIKEEASAASASDDAPEAAAEASSAAASEAAPDETYEASSLPASDRDAALNALTLTPSYPDNRELGAILDEIMPAVTDGCGTTAEAVRACYDYVILNGRYSKTVKYDYAQDAILFLTEHRGSCTYYVAALHYMLEYIGVDNRIVDGYRYPREDSREASFHRWIEITADGTSYLLDPQWEDAISGGDGVLYERYMKTHEEVSDYYRF